jgi:hypothetical protein
VQTAAKQFHKSKTPTLLLKLDIAKDFETVSWTYIIDMLEARGFPLRWRNWISLLFSICFFKSSCQWGARQENPTPSWP